MRRGAAGAQWSWGEEGQAAGWRGARQGSSCERAQGRASGMEQARCPRHWVMMSSGPGLR